MAGKFIDLKAAAKQLGITPEQLQEMREAGKVHGYKDGASWKFKVEEIERLATEVAEDSDDFELSDSASLSGDDFDRLLNLDEDSDSDEQLQDSSILISGEQPAVDEDSSSTVIGQKIADDLSEIRLASDSDDDELKLAGSSARELPGPAGSDLADSADLSDELRVADDLEFESDEGLMLPDQSDISLSAESSDPDVLDVSDSSELAVGEEEGSGIGLANPADSGLLLEGASSSAELELPEDDEMISLEDELAASDDATRLQQDEEFLLSPSDEMLGDDSSDSGSQVIALDDSGAFGDSAVGLEEAEPLLVAEEGEGLGTGLEPLDDAVAEASRATMVGAGELAEVPYTAWNLVALILVVLLLAVSGMLMADVVRNMWAWSGESGLAGGIANAIVDALGMNN